MDVDMDVDEGLRSRGWCRDCRVNGGGGGGGEKKTLLANKTRGLATREGEGGRSRLALGASIEHQSRGSSE